MLWTVSLHVLAAAAVLLKPPGIPIVDMSDVPKLIAGPVPPYDKIYYFDQLIDHNDPSKGKFRQRYWHTAEFYQPGKYFSSDF
jgi:hypothetical protein